MLNPARNGFLTYSASLGVQNAAFTSSFTTGDAAAAQTFLAGLTSTSVANFAGGLGAPGPIGSDGSDDRLDTPLVLTASGMPTSATQPCGPSSTGARCSLKKTSPGASAPSPSWMIATPPGTRRD